MIVELSVHEAPESRYNTLSAICLVNKRLRDAARMILYSQISVKRPVCLLRTFIGNPDLGLLARTVHVRGFIFIETDDILDKVHIVAITSKIQQQVADSVVREYWYARLRAGLSLIVEDAGFGIIIFFPLSYTLNIRELRLNHTMPTYGTNIIFNGFDAVLHASAVPRGVPVGCLQSVQISRSTVPVNASVRIFKLSTIRKLEL